MITVDGVEKEYEYIPYPKMVDRIIVQDEKEHKEYLARKAKAKVAKAKENS